uniref:Transcription factor PRE6 n=1 Tax=Noccaea caerulescens TaxID=107243 RepID=A0A1J3FT75_NOCCA
MKSRRSRSRQSGRCRASDNQVAELAFKLQHLIHQSYLRSFDKVPASKILEETCNYIENLHRDVDNLSDQLSELLASMDDYTGKAAITRSLLHC